MTQWAKPSLVLAILGGVLAAHVQGQTLEPEVRVLVVDRGADLSIPQLHSQAFTTPQCSTFPNATLGWNLVSNDATYMPSWVLDRFDIDLANTKVLLDLYSRLEGGDPNARAELLKHRSQFNQIEELLDFAHGTHVSGILIENAPNIRIQSLNAFDASHDDRLIDRVPSVPMAEIGAVGDDPATTPTKPTVDPKTPTVFDDRDEVLKTITDDVSDDLAIAGSLTNYIDLTRPRVVNLSLGSCQSTIKTFAEGLWTKEMQKRGLDPKSARSKVQQENFDLLVSGIYRSTNAAWKKLITAHPDVLFVAAAGNEGDAPADADLNTNPCTPATLSRELPNIWSIAATNYDGRLADFSSYGKLDVDFGALGVAVASIAPRNIPLRMSGTSMAAPLVAQTAAQVMSILPALTINDVHELLIASGRKSASLLGRTKSGVQIVPDSAIAFAKARRDSLPLPPAPLPTEKMRAWDYFFIPVGDFNRPQDSATATTPDLVRWMIRQLR